MEYLTSITQNLKSKNWVHDTKKYHWRYFFWWKYVLRGQKNFHGQVKPYFLCDDEIFTHTKTRTPAIATVQVETEANQAEPRHESTMQDDDYAYVPSSNDNQWNIDTKAPENIQLAVPDEPKSHTPKTWVDNAFYE